MFSTNPNFSLSRRRAAQMRLPIIIAIVAGCALIGVGAGRLLAGRGSSPAAATPSITDLGAAKDATINVQETSGELKGSRQPPRSVPAPAKTAVETEGVQVLPPETDAPLPLREEAPPLPTSPRDGPAPVQGGATAGEKTIVYGRSFKGTSLKAYVLGNGPNVTLFFGAFHGNEASTPGLVMALRRYLIGHPALLSGKTVILAPVVNPDGLGRGTRVNARGVDLNRNFPGTWKKEAAKTRYNPGSEPSSEPETRAVIALMNQFSPQKVVSFHQPFHTLNYTGEPGKRLAQAMQKQNGYPITPDIGYPTPGSFGDYCGKSLGIAIVTCELPAQSADAAWRANQKACLAAIELPS